MEFARPIEVNLDDARPSFFDLLAKSNFDNLLQPLIEPFLAPQFPSAHERIYFAVKAVIDLAMISGFGGITSEVFYGLERHVTSHKSVLYLVTLLECHLFPLIKSNAHFQSFFPKSLIKLLKCLDVLVKLAYITGDTKSFSLLHFITGITFKHSSTTLYDRTDTLGKIVKYFMISGQLVVYLIQSGFFDRIKSRNQIKNRNIPSIAPDVSDLALKADPHGFPVPPRAGICPVCSEEWKNPVALSSGYIYCQKCIKSDMSLCPVTRLKISGIIPLFLQY